MLSLKRMAPFYYPQWLKKQAEARKPVDIDDPDLTEEEKNPQWLKEKGE